MSDTITQAKERLTIPALGAMLFPEWKPAKSCRSPFREDRNPSFSVHDGGRKFRDFATARSGDAIDFLALARGLSNAEAVRAFLRLAGMDDAREAVPVGAVVPKVMQRIEQQFVRSDRTPTFPDDLRPGTPAELTILAKLRNLNREAVKIASERGLLHFGTMHDGRSTTTVWTITDRDRRNGQARRLDGLPWQSLPGTPKAKTLPGSAAAWPVGIQEATTYSCIAVVEGGPDLLAALHFGWAEGKESAVTPVAMLGASLSIPDQVLSMFSGKRVRIFPHTDDAGQDAAARWEQQLVAVGAEVDCFSLSGISMTTGEPVGDLNDLASIHADQFEEDRDLWNIFDCAEVAA